MSNASMFGDATQFAERGERQGCRFEDFLDAARNALVMFELGAGTTIPTIRHLSERLVSHYGGTLIRINPREEQVPKGQISLAMGALEGLEQIELRLQ